MNVQTGTGDDVVGRGDLDPETSCGFAYIPAILGPPTETPDHIPGFVAVAYDVLNGRLYAYHPIDGWNYEKMKDVEP